MKISKKSQSKGTSLYPVLYVMDSLKEYHHMLVQSEVESLYELSMVNRSFGKVLAESENFKGTLDDFEQNFSNINTASSQFDSVKENISQSVVEAQGEVEELKKSSLQVEAHFHEMKSTFDTFQLSLNKIRKCMEKIVTIADQTNILASVR